MTVKKTVGLITAICFILNGLFAVSVFAASESVTSGAAVQISVPLDGGTSTDSAIKNDGEADEDIGENVEEDIEEDIDQSLDEATPSTTDSAIDTTGSAVATTPKAVGPAKNDENKWYIPQIPMKKEHQKLLWDYCSKRKIDYVDMLALISVESHFYEKCSSRGFKGYFQISSKHGKNLAATLKTANNPLDGAININWGTALYSWILADKRVKGLTGKKQRDAALSIYQRGTGGYDRYGINKRYLVQYYKKRDIIVSYVEQNKKNRQKSLSE